jgi:HNH endonuclease
MVAQRALNRCEYCYAPEVITNFAFEVEHIIATSQQGTDTEDNLALSCRACNLFKSNRMVGVDPETGSETALFHPRQDDWNAHFIVDAGRATVQGLQINSEFQISARVYWAQMALFP